MKGTYQADKAYNRSRVIIKQGALTNRSRQLISRD
ncbi:hypothetical protein CGLO_00947 [Colletotrichum gloeosporioides Cg-14]|uniref:Uncharacterized protein n=1 Tax=Colletotrichum gloeosporioides (strain Cg-14) TaxID=1237896 RepID=T0KT91_COLGC|nr:hypothetical protein CGLO_00947 [Colletotrichum gloeosporioides Cg-14]